MKTDHVPEGNLEIVLDWLDAMRVGDPDRFAHRLHPDVVWWDVSGDPACRGRDEVLDWLRLSATAPRDHTVEGLELIATSEYAVLGIATPSAASWPGCRSKASCSSCSRSATERSSSSETTRAATKRCAQPAPATAQPGGSCKDVSHQALARDEAAVAADLYSLLA
jgi:hypothetical protein